MKNVNKLNVLAASVAVAISGNAQALVVGGQMGALGADFGAVVGGATAPRNFFYLDQLIRICDHDPALPRRVYTNSVTTPPTVDGTVILETGNHQVVHCTTKDLTLPDDAPIPGLGTPNNFTGIDFAVYKLNGGSATGVSPVVDPANAIAVAPASASYLDAVHPADPLNPTGAECAPVFSFEDPVDPANNENAWPISDTGATYELYECPNSPIVTQAPDAGISDVEPTIFRGSLSLDFGIEPLGVTAKPDQPFPVGGETVLNVNPGPGLIFGTAVTLPMYNELGADQYEAGLLPECETVIGAPGRAAYVASAQSVKDRIECMPSLPSEMIRGAFLGQYTSWDQFRPYGLPLDTDTVTGPTTQGPNVHLCKRTNGSGTHAQFSVHYLGTNCTATSNFSMIEHNDGISVAAADLVGMYANRGSSDVTKCLNALGNGAGNEGDFDGLPPTAFPNTGDSSVVPGNNMTVTDPSGTEVPIVGDETNQLFRLPGTETPVLENTAQRYDNLGVPFTAYGMGYNSMENNTGLTSAYRFVKVDGASPTINDALTGAYSDVYYLSFQWRHTGNTAVADTLTGNIRDLGALSAGDQTDTLNAMREVNEDYFTIWFSTDANAIAAVNRSLVVSPDGVAGGADDWETGYVTAIAGANQDYTVSGVPETPWSRQNASAQADSCQDLGPVR